MYENTVLSDMDRLSLSSPKKVAPLVPPKPKKPQVSSNTNKQP